jgi:tetratricopeptide (TPR) repeat protein
VFWFALVLSATPPLSGGDPALVGVWAANSPRPPECRSGSSPRASAWDRARWARESSRCLALGRGATWLHSSPERALALSEELLAAKARDVDARVLAGRALLRLGRPAESWESFEAARELDPSRLEAPVVLEDLARVALLNGRYDRAREAHLSLARRMSLASERGRSVRVRIEAALTAMLVAPDGTAEAIDYLSAVTPTVSLPVLDDLALGALALALDRAGQGPRAAAVVRRVGGPWRVDELTESPPTPAQSQHLPVMPEGEVHAIVATLAGPVDRALGRRHWQAFLEARGAGPHTEHARRALARLGGGGER